MLRSTVPRPDGLRLLLTWTPSLSLFNRDGLGIGEYHGSIQPQRIGNLCDTVCVLNQCQNSGFAGLCLNASRVGHILRTNWLTSPVGLHIHLHACDYHAQPGRLAEEIIAVTPANGKQEQFTSIEA